MNCKAAQKILSAYLDDELSSLKRTRLEEHLAVCPSCRLYQHDLQQISRAISSRHDELLPMDFAAIVRKKLESGAVEAKPARAPRRWHNTRWQYAFSATVVVAAFLLVLNAVSGGVLDMSFPNTASSTKDTSSILLANSTESVLNDPEPAANSSGAASASGAETGTAEAGGTETGGAAPPPATEGPAAGSDQNNTAPAENEKSSQMLMSNAGNYHGDYEGESVYVAGESSYGNVYSQRLRLARADAAVLASRLDEIADNYGGRSIGGDGSVYYMAIPNDYADEALADAGSLGCVVSRDVVLLQEERHGTDFSNRSSDTLYSKADCKVLFSDELNVEDLDLEETTIIIVELMPE